MLARPALVFSSALLLAACGTGDSPGLPVVVTDSAGVKIIENPAPTELGPWTRTVGATLLRHAPGADAPEPPLYRISGARRLSDGRLAVSDQGAKGVRLYSAQGVWERTMGAEGQGPGEFQNPVLLGLVGEDSLVVGDVDNRRITILHPDVGLVRTAAIPDAAGGYPIPQGLLDDGSVLVGGGFFFSSGQGRQMQSGVSRGPTTFAALFPDGALRAALGEFPGIEMYWEVSASGLRGRLIPFGKIPVAAAGASRIYLGTSDRYEILAFDQEGALREIIRSRYQPPAVSAEDLRHYRDERLEDADDAEERRQIEDDLNQTPPAERWPAYQSFLVDGAGRLWVGAYRGPGDDDPVYAVFAADGRMLGTVAFPPRFRPFDIGDDYVLGSRFDELDQETLEMVALQGG